MSALCLHWGVEIAHLEFERGDKDNESQDGCCCWKGETDETVERDDEVGDGEVGDGDCATGEGSCGGGVTHSLRMQLGSSTETAHDHRHST